MKTTRKMDWRTEERKRLESVHLASIANNRISTTNEIDSDAILARRISWFTKYLCGSSIKKIAEKNYISASDVKSEFNVINRGGALASAVKNAILIRGKRKTVNRLWTLKYKLERRDMGSPLYVRWRKEVFKRDKWRCQLCFFVGGLIEAHHIRSWAKYPRLRYLVTNGITLCEECHKSVHRKKLQK